MKKLLTFFTKPTLKAKLIKGGTQAKVTLSNINAQQTLILLYMAIQQIAIAVRMDKRQVLNRLLELDSQIKRTEKQLQKEAKYGKKKK